MTDAMVTKGDNIKNILPDTLYTKVDEWFKREANIGLAMLNSFKPISVMTVLMATTQQKYFPNKPGETQLDTYFQNMGTSLGKQVFGLETYRTK